jgi:glycosyltransferase involved in cell wall biosynthesis
MDDYLGGLLSQTYENVELIVYDDGSTDATWQRLQDARPALQRKFARVVIERHENMGPSLETILGFEQARGELICQLESDDYYLPRRFETVVRYFEEHPSVGAVHSDVDYVYGDRVEAAHWKTIGRPIPTGDVFDDLLVDNFVMMCSFCSRTDLVRKHVELPRYIERGYLATDYAIFLDLARHTEFGYIDEPLARYRVLANSLSHSTDRDRSFTWQLSTYAMKLDYLREHDVSPETAAHVERQYYDFLYRGGLRARKREASREGYAWLRRRYPDEHAGPVHLFFRLIARSRLLCALFSGLLETRPVAATWARVRLRRRWRREVLDNHL